MGRNFEGKTTSNSGNQVGIKSENKWQKSYKDFQIIISAIVLGHCFWCIVLRWLELFSDKIGPLLWWIVVNNWLKGSLALFFHIMCMCAHFSHLWFKIFFCLQNALCKNYDSESNAHIILHACCYDRFCCNSFQHACVFTKLCPPQEQRSCGIYLYSLAQSWARVSAQSILV